MIRLFCCPQLNEQNPTTTTAKLEVVVGVWAESNIMLRDTENRFYVLVFEQYFTTGNEVKADKLLQRVWILCCVSGYIDIHIQVVLKDTEDFKNYKWKVV